jgi:hypothetical protein
MVGQTAACLLGAALDLPQVLDNGALARFKADLLEWARWVCRP